MMAPYTNAEFLIGVMKIKEMDSDKTDEMEVCQEKQSDSGEESTEDEEVKGDTDMTDGMEVTPEHQDVVSEKEHMKAEAIKSDTDMTDGVEESTSLIKLEERDDNANDIGREYVAVDEAIARCDAAVAKHENSFIEVGFWLSYIKKKIPEIRDYNTIEDFALAKYGIKRAQVYNYIAVWDYYGVLCKDIDGTLKPVIRKEYSGFCLTQLREMIKLSDETRKTITPSQSVASIKGARKRANTKTKAINHPSGTEEIEPSEYIETLNAETWEELAQKYNTLLNQRPVHPSGFSLSIKFH